MPVTVQDAARELFDRRQARKRLLEYIRYSSPKYKVSLFSELVCKAIDEFLEQVQAGLRPVLILQAPPQHGKSEIVSRKLPAYILGKFPDWRLGTASYSDDLAHTMSQDVRRNIASPEHQRLFPSSLVRRKYDINRIGEFSAPNGSGSYLGVGVGAGLTGRPVDIGIIDDPVKNEKEALSPTTKEGHWAWYQSVFTTRLSEKSGQIIMATSWAEDDLPGRILAQFAGDKRLTHLRFPAINDPRETGFRPELPLGALVPELHSIEKLLETKGILSDYWWSSLYQQNPKSLGGNVFKEIGIQFWLPKDLPSSWDKVIDSWDCTFKDTDGTDYVVGQKWAKKGANSYLLAQRRRRMSFTATCDEVKSLHEEDPRSSEILIEDKANGPAVIDTLKKFVAGILPIEPDGSKLARAHAVTSYWEARNVWLPHPHLNAWVTGSGKLDHFLPGSLLSELTTFPAAANDDQVDSLSQALRRLYPLFGRLKVSQEAINRAMGLRK